MEYHHRSLSLVRTMVVMAVAATGGTAWGATLYVAKSGSDSGNSCRDQTKPCATITKGISAMSGGDTLVVGDGTYAESITGMPSGTAAAYTTIKAANDWGVTIDGSKFSNNYTNGITVSSKSYVIVQGFHVKMNQANANNEPIQVPYSDHVKIIRCSASYGSVTGNSANIDVGPMSSYVLVEECYAFGGSRYQILVYQSDHVVVRRTVARTDYWNDVLQCADFTNYDSVQTAWQNNIAIDSDTANCMGKMYAGFFNENKDDTAPDTSEEFHGDIILNVNAFYAGILDWVATGTHTLKDVAIWGSSGGYYGDKGPGVTPMISGTGLTVGGITGKYDGANSGAAWGTGVSIYSAVQNSFTNSLFTKNASLGVADYTSSDYNAFGGNAANYGGTHKAAAGAHDLADDSAVSASFRYLPRIEAGSPLATAGMGGAQVGAQIMYMVGKSGTLHDEAGWDDVTNQPLWPFPNEAVIKADMGAYTGPGAKGARGFTTGNSLDGTPQTLTKYVWEAVGNQIPAEIYGFHVSGGPLPNAIVNQPYTATVAAGGGKTPYTLMVSGDLPAGLSFAAATGTISGTPTATGTSTFKVTGSDASSPALTSTATLTLTVIDAPVTSPTGGSVGTGGSSGGSTGGGSTGGGSTGGGSTGGGATGDPTGAGGSSGLGGSGVAPDGTLTGGCSCTLPARDRRAPGAPLPIVALLVALAMRRRRAR